MAVPVPPQDRSGGIMVLQVSDGTRTHRIRFHVLAFNDDTTGTYISPPAGRETSITATFNALSTPLKGLWPSSYTLSLAALYHVDASGNATQTFAVTFPSPATCNSPGTANTTPGAFFCYNYKTSRGSRARFFAFNPAGWAYAQPSNLTASDGMTAYLTGTSTSIVAHDGSQIALPGKLTVGINKKLRRKSGWA